MSGLLVCSNRGPLAWSNLPDGGRVAKRGAGGLVSGLEPLVAEGRARWIAAAMNDVERELAREGGGGTAELDVRLLDIPPDEYARAYDLVANATLWPLHHGLFDRARQPLFDGAWRLSWAAFRRYNERFAEAVSEQAARGATVLVQDYHLSLLPAMLSERRGDLAVVHFSHTPFASPEELRTLPDDVRVELLTGLAAARACGFHTARWADAFAEGCSAVAGLAARTFVAPLGPDPAALAAAAASPETVRAGAELDAWVGDRQLVVRVDRVEPSKNVLRGLRSFAALLEADPRAADRTAMLALAYPSRQTLADYRTYQREVEELTIELLGRWAATTPAPLRVEVADDYPRSVAALQRYDVLLVNPIRDGLNMVAKEGPLLNRRNGSVVLSREAGAFTELAAGAFPLNPFDVTETASQLAAALACSRPERERRAATLEEAARAHSPDTWLQAQLAAASS